MPMDSGHLEVSRVRSGLIASQLWPPLMVFNSMLPAEIQHVRIDRRKNHRHGAHEAIFAAAASGAGAMFCTSPVDLIEARHLAAVNDVGIERIGRDVAVFFDAHRLPVAEGDLAVIAAAGDADRAALLLAAVDPIGKPIVGDDVIELRGGLVVPGAPRLAAVDGDGRALVAGQDDDVGIRRD